MLTNRTTGWPFQTSTQYGAFSSCAGLRVEALLPRLPWILLSFRDASAVDLNVKGGLRRRCTKHP
jgi:hypothetical protein